MQEYLNLNFLISKVLSYAVVFGAIILKVPQIVNILKSGSADGISLTSLLMETTGFAIAASWGIAQELDFKDYGENIFIIAQLLVLNFLVANHYSRTFHTIVASALICGGAWALSMGMVPADIHRLLLSFQVVLNMSSRIPQIYLNYRHRSTGQLSFVTFFLAFAGGVARVMTTAVNVDWAKGKTFLLGQFSIGVFLNAIIIFQIIFYTGLFPEKKKQKTTKKKD